MPKLVRKGKAAAAYARAAGRLTRACPRCHAPIGTRCYKFKTDKGERIMIVGYKVTVCDERKT